MTYIINYRDNKRDVCVQWREDKQKPYKYNVEIINRFKYKAESEEMLEYHRALYMAGRSDLANVVAYCHNMVRKNIKSYTESDAKE